MMEAETMDGSDGTREVEDEGNIRLDPFVQPPILKALFEQLPMEDLAKCRLVSKLWYEESLSTWRSNATINVEEGGIVSTRDDSSRRTTTLREFLDRWEAGEWDLCPFKRFNLSCWKFKADEVEQDRFLQVVGSHVTSLTLGWCSFEGRKEFRRIISQPFPKLQFLKMEGCDVRDRDDATNNILEYKEPAFGVHGLKSLDISYCNPQTIMDLLSRFHKVKNLHSHANGPPDYQTYRSLLEVIRLIRTQDQTKLPLQNFDVKFAFKLGLNSAWARRAEYFGTASSVELLKLHDDLNLPLQRLEIYSHLGDYMDRDFPNVISDIMQYHSSALKYLKFSGDMYGLCKSFPFGFTYENLEELVIGTEQFCDSLDYLRFTPNLRVLDIRGYASYGLLHGTVSDKVVSNSSQLEIGDWTLPTLRELKLFSPLLSHCNLGKLMKWMPNVERLSGIELDDVKFVMVCNNWKNLKHLSDSGVELTDEGVLGIENVGEREADGNEEIQGGPNITKLNDLTSFGTYSRHLTSASVHDGFLKLDNLNELFLKGLDDEAITALEKRKIRPRSGYW